MKRLIFGIMTGIAFALGAMINQAEPSVAPTQSGHGREPAAVQEVVPLPLSAEGYPAPMYEPYPYPGPEATPYPQPEATQRPTVILIPCTAIYEGLCAVDPMPTPAPTMIGTIQ